MSRRLILALVGVLSMLAVGSGRAEAHHLFAEHSGFAKAREARESLRVCAPPVIDGPSVIAPWNELAGWRLFVISCDRPDITFVPDAVTWTQATYLKPFTYCRIHYASPLVRSIQHEIGHCLGFADHVETGNGHGGRWVNPGSCAGYRGVMSYCDWDGRHWFGEDDHAMLSRAGYAAPISTGAHVPAGSPPGGEAPAASTSRAPSFPSFRWLVQLLSRYRVR